MTPATKPQNAEPIPNSVTPEAVTKKVITAASRPEVWAIAVVRLLAIVLNKASQARAKTNSLGNAANNPATTAPGVDQAVITGVL